MVHNKYTKSLIAVNTATNKSENQDCINEFEGDNFNTLFLADGLGSFKYPLLASERIISFFKNGSLELNTFYDHNTFGKLKFDETFRKAKQDLIEYSIGVIKQDEKKEENLFGTTAITLIETSDKISIAYVGNGAIWHIRGNFHEFGESNTFPWNAINYLNPHTIPENGKEALYRLISDNSDFNECIPSVIEISKDVIHGEIIMICTDGIYSADQVKVGKNDKGVWFKYDNKMLKFFQYLIHFFKTNQIYNKESIEQILKEYLDEIKPLLDDDATIGLLITKEALNFQNSINWSIKNENNSNF